MSEVVKRMVALALHLQSEESLFQRATAIGDDVEAEQHRQKVLALTEAKLDLLREQMIEILGGTNPSEPTRRGSL